MMEPIIATMIGDPAGVGPEVCAKALATGLPRRGARPLLIGSLDAVERAIGFSGLNLRVRAVRSVAEAQFAADVIDVFDPGTLAAGEWRIGEAGAASGRAVRDWIRIANRLAGDGDIDGWISAPINSKSMQMGRAESGDDEGLAPPESFLLRISGNLRIVALSEHLALREVPASVTRERIGGLLGLLDATLRRWGVAAPRIAVAGLNPHASGREEEEVIGPAVMDARARGIDARGPAVPDAVFRQCLERRHDVVVSMYHDQGQIALKTACFEGACSVYLGMPYVRVTVPHGSAFDIAGKGVAQHQSMLNAMLTAAALSAGRYSVERQP
jgi:4-hydroxythreonine-4-phosphate dehydrogenase